MIAQACWIMHLILFPHDTSCDVLHMYLGNARWPAFNVLIRPPMAMIDGIDAVNRPNIASVSSNRCIWSMLGVCSLRSGVQIRHIRHCDAVHSVRRQFRPPKPSSMSMIDGIDAVNRPNIASLSSNRCIWSMLGVGSLRRGVEIRLWSPSTVPAAHYKPSSMSIIEVLLDIAADCRPSSVLISSNGYIWSMLGVSLLGGGVCVWLWCGCLHAIYYRLSLFPAALWTAF